jgi:methylenetetrahydrofolate reductase (NADPH)
MQGHACLVAAEQGETETGKAMRNAATAARADAGDQAEARFLPEVVRRLASNWSIELTPRETERFGAAVRDHLPSGTKVFITWLAGKEFAPSVAAAAKLRLYGLEPVPHLAARAIRDEATLADMLTRLRGEAGVRQALLIAGAVPQPKGCFEASIQVLETGLLEHYGIRDIGVAAHPEGSPDIPAPALEQALAEKNEYARRSGARLELTTQFCFDHAPITQWEKQARAAGNRLPITIGVAGLAGVTTLVKHARNCGVGSSIGVLLKQATKVLRLATAVDPSDLIIGLARAKGEDAGSAISRLHFFPFGAFEATARYAQALTEGRFEIVDGDQRISVHP